MFEPGSPLERLRQVVADYFPVTGEMEYGGRPAFTVDVPPDSKARFLALRERLEQTGLQPLLRMNAGRAVMAFLPKPPPAQWRWTINLLLFVGTLGTTFLSGFILARELESMKLIPSAVQGGLEFAISLMLILLVHEMGHKVVSVVRGIDASLPYFIPMIPPIGTMGALILTREPAPNRDALVDLGASGPIAGFVVAVGVVIVGLRMSFVINPAALAGQEVTSFSDPLLIQWLADLLIHPPSGYILWMHPILFAGWIGLLVTSINLLPGSMLDAGHVVRALFGGRWHSIVSWVAVLAAIALRYYVMAALLAVLLSSRPQSHPGPLDDVSPVGRSRWIIGAVLLVIFVVSVTRVDMAIIKF